VSEPWTPERIAAIRARAEKLAAVGRSSTDNEALEAAADITNALDEIKRLQAQLAETEDRAQQELRDAGDALKALI
jgi:CRISPR/Cas system CMR-associated protein Cmr5 small subunit